MVGAKRMGYSIPEILVSFDILQSIMPLLQSVDSAVDNDESLIIMTRGVWLDFSPVTNKLHWFKLHLYSMQEVQDVHQIVQFGVL